MILITPHKDRIAGVKFRTAGTIYYFNAGHLDLKPKDLVIAQTEQGLGLGTVVHVLDELPEHLKHIELKKIKRFPNEEDLLIFQENSVLAASATKFCRKCIKERELDMKLVSVDIFHDRSKMIFYFTAPGRVDFRELVKDLVREYRTRIELRQIGVRHEAQMVGVIGNCGEVCCCTRYIRQFAPVTIKMAKEQNLFLNPKKISGICGRLLCCLSFEQIHYEDFRKRCPKVGKRFLLESYGQVKVLRANLFRESVTVQLEEGEEKEIALAEWAELFQGNLSGSTENDPEAGKTQEEQDFQGELFLEEDQFDSLVDLTPKAEEPGKPAAAKERRRKKRKK